MVNRGGQVMEAKIVQQVKDLYPDMPTKKLADQLGISINQIRWIAQKEGLKKSEAFNNSPESGRLSKGDSRIKHKVIPDQIKQRVKLLYPDTSTKELAEMIGISVKEAYGIARYLGLKKSVAFLKSEASGRLKKGRAQMGDGTRFQKGFTPWNKGKKVQSTEGMKATQFKKGMLPHNTKYDGHERITVDGYVEVRGSQGKYRGKHIIVWEAINGEIPKGMLVVFKDGNKQNCDIGNLEIITRAENMKRNTIHRYSEELKPVVILIGKLKNKVHEKSNRRSKKSSVCSA